MLVSSKLLYIYYDVLFSKSTHACVQYSIMMILKLLGMTFCGPASLHCTLNSYFFIPGKSQEVGTGYWDTFGYQLLLHFPLMLESNTGTHDDAHLQEKDATDDGHYNSASYEDVIVILIGLICYEKLKGVHVDLDEGTT